MYEVKNIQEDQIFQQVTGSQCCGAGVGGAEIILDMEPEPNYLFVSLKDARMKKN